MGGEGNGKGKGKGSSSKGGKEGKCKSQWRQNHRDIIQHNKNRGALASGELTIRTLETLRALNGPILHKGLTTSCKADLKVACNERDEIHKAYFKACNLSLSVCLSPTHAGDNRQFRTLPTTVCPPWLPERG